LQKIIFGALKPDWWKPLFDWESPRFERKKKMKSERFFFQKNFQKIRGKNFSTPFKHKKIGFWWIFFSQSFPLEIALNQDSKFQSRSEEILSNLELFFFCEKILEKFFELNEVGLKIFFNLFRLKKKIKTLEERG